MKQTTKVFLREELYEHVGATPVHRIAKEFGYSDVGLAKLCRKHQIPTPGLSYWEASRTGSQATTYALASNRRTNPLSD